MFSQKTSNFDDLQANELIFEDKRRHFGSGRANSLSERSQVIPPPPLPPIAPQLAPPNYLTPDNQGSSTIIARIEWQLFTRMTRVSRDALDGYGKKKERLSILRVATLSRCLDLANSSVVVLRESEQTSDIKRTHLSDVIHSHRDSHH